MAVFGVLFEHLYTDENGVGMRDIDNRNSSSAIPPSSFILTRSKEWSDDTRDVAAPAVHRFLPIPLIHYT
jgi:hypothetical protein